MSEIASAWVSLVPSAKGFGSKMESQVSGEVGGAATSLGSKFGKMFAIAGGLLAAAGIGHFLKDSIAEAREAQKVGALTASVIKATGGAANVSAKQVGNLASALSLKTGIDDEVIQSGQNMLLTFKNIRNEAGKGNDIFDQTSATLVDLAAAMGSDPKNAAIQLGKALNDPVKGVSALSRVGVTFTEGQKKVIGSLVDSGNVMGAQKIILKELNSEFGGAAAAQATAGEKAAVALGNLKEQVGTALLPLLDKIEMGFVKLTPAISRAIAGIGPAFGKVADVFKRIGDAFGLLFKSPDLLNGAHGFAEVLDNVFGNTGRLIDPLVSLGSVIQGVANGVQAFVYSFKTGFTGDTGIVGMFEQLGATARSTIAQMLPAFQRAGVTLQTVVLPAVASLVTYVGTAMLPIFTRVAGIIRDQVVPIVASFASFLYGSLYPAIVQIVMAVGSKLKPVFDQYVATLKGQIIPAVQSLLAKFREHQPAIQAAVLAVTKIIGKVLEFAAAVLAKVLPVVIRFQGFMAGQFIRGIGTAIGVLVQIVKAVIKVGQQFIIGAKQIADFVKAVVAGINKANTVIASLPGKVKAALVGMYEAGKHAAEELIRGLVSGLLAGVNKVKDAVSSVASAIKDHFPGSPVKTGPLLSWNNGGAGKRLVGMLADGLTAAAPTAAAAAEKVANAVRDHLEKMRDKVKSIVDGLKSDFASLSDSVASAFSGDVFSAKNGSDFFGDLLHQQGTLQHLRRAFKKLLKWGLDPKFLSALFQSGNQALIFDLADGTKTQALVDSQIFAANQSIASSLGNNVAQADIGPELKRQTHRLDQIENHLKHLPKNIGHELNGAVRHGQRKASK